MVETDPVRIVVELVHNIEDDLAEIQAGLEKLDDQVIDPDFEIDEGGEIGRIRSEMRTLERRLESVWNVDTREGDMAKVMAWRESLEGDIESELDIEGLDEVIEARGMIESLRQDIEAKYGVSLDRDDIAEIVAVREGLEKKINSKLDIDDDDMKVLRAKIRTIQDNIRTKWDVDMDDEDVGSVLAAIRSMDQDVTADFEINEEGEIAEAQAGLETLQRHLEAELGVRMDKDDIVKVLAARETLDEDITAKYDIEDGADIESIRARIETLTRDLRSKWNVSVDKSDVAEVLSVREMLDDDIDVDLEGLKRRVAQIDYNAEIDPRDVARVQSTKRMMERRMSSEWNVDIDTGDVARAMMIRKALGRKITTRLGSMGLFGAGTSAIAGEGALGLGKALGIGTGEGGEAVIEGFNRKFRKLGGTLKRLTPSIMDWWQVLALLIPVVITLGAALIGVVAALGAMATAATALVGIGLVGWGDSTTETMQEVRQEVSRLKEELFAAIQPAATEFAPISRRWIRGVPEQVARLNDELRQMTEFEGGLAAAGAGLVGWVEEALQAMVNLREEAVQVSLRMGEALGSFLIDLLRFGLTELYENQEAFVKLGDAFVDIIATLYNLSKAVTFALAKFGPLFDIVVMLTDVLSNKWATAIIFTAIGLTSLAFAAGNVMAILLGWTGLGMMSWLAAFQAKIVALTAELAAMYLELQLIYQAIIGIGTALGVGLLAWGASQILMQTAGPSRGTAGTRAGSRGATTVNDITIQGDVGDKEMHRLLDHMETNG